VAGSGGGGVRNTVGTLGHGKETIMRYTWSAPLKHALPATILPALPVPTVSFGCHRPARKQRLLISSSPHTDAGKVSLLPRKSDGDSVANPSWRSKHRSRAYPCQVE